MYGRILATFGKKCENYAEECGENAGENAGKMRLCGNMQNYGENADRVIPPPEKALHCLVFFVRHG